MQVILFILMLTACTEHIIALGFVTFIKLVLGTNKCVGCPEHSRAIGNWQGCEAKTFFFYERYPIVMHTDFLGLFPPPSLSTRFNLDCSNGFMLVYSIFVHWYLPCPIS